MIVQGYGIRLIRLQPEDIELVRKWRNSPEINQYMEYRERITPEMQQEWFNSIDNLQNNYMVIEIEGTKIGLINGAEIDWEKQETGSGGIFIWDNTYWNTKHSIGASLLLTDVSLILGLKRTYIKVLKDNPKAIAFNKQLGYELLPGQDEVYNQKYVLESSRYLEKREKLRKLLFDETEYNPIRFIVNDKDHPVTAFYVQKIKKQIDAGVTGVVLEEA